MIRGFIGIFLALDTWLQERLGRPYNILLTIGLVIEIVTRIKEAPHHLASKASIAETVLAVVLEVALLIHQIGQLSHRIGHKKDEPAPVA
jgi:hypothetical protein